MASEKDVTICEIIYIDSHYHCIMRMGSRLELVLALLLETFVNIIWNAFLSPAV